MFNKKQLQVINELDKNILLCAGAGTGKTNVLSYRVANILQKDKAQPGEILCLTFTNKACRELKNRISAQLDFNTAQDITIRTIHGFAYQIITLSAKARQKIFQEYVIFDDEDQKALIRQTLSKYPKGKSLDLQYIVNCIEALKQERALKHLHNDIETDYTALYQQHVQFNKAFNQQESDSLAKFFQFDGLNIIIAYEHALHQMNGLDYKDLIANAYRLLQDEDIRRIWHDKYRYIMIDEMQDTSIFEYTMLHYLFPARNVMLCGDEFQTIYEWRGSNPERILKDFREKYNPLVINFTENYRSTKLLLEMAYNTLLNLFHKDVIEHSYAKNMIAKSNERGHKIKFRQFRNTYDEARWIFDNIVRLLPQTENLSDIAILVRQNKYLYTLAAHLTAISNAYNQKYPQNQLHFIQIDNIKFFKRQEIKDVTAVLKYLINSDDYLSLERILINLVPNIGIGTIRRIASEEYLNAGLRLSDFVNANFSDEYYEPFAALIHAYTAKDIIVFDIEGTGTDIFTDNIIQLSAVRIHRGQQIASFNKYLQSAKSVGDSEKVHHISDEFLAQNGENPADVLTAFKEFIHDAVITGHNIRGYDMDILNQNLIRHGLAPLDFTGINFDTLDLARRFYPNLPNHKLEYLSTSFNLNTKSNHNSFDDVLATWDLLHKMLEEKIISTAPKRRELISRHKNRFSKPAEILLNLRRNITEDISLEKLIALIVDEFQLKTVYNEHSPDGANRINNLRTLYLIARQELAHQTGLNGIKELLQYAALSGSDLDALTAGRPKIPIITVHQAKGLEFKYEFLAGMNDDVFPSYFSTQGGFISEEEKRLFYVAITRTKKELFISCSGRKSRLLANIPEQFIDDVPSS